MARSICLVVSFIRSNCWRWLPADARATHSATTYDLSTLPPYAYHLIPPHCCLHHRHSTPHAIHLRYWSPDSYSPAPSNVVSSALFDDCTLGWRKSYKLVPPFLFKVERLNSRKHDRTRLSTCNRGKKGGAQREKEEIRTIVELCDTTWTFGVSDQKLSARCCIAVTRPQRISLLALYLLALAVDYKADPAASFSLPFSLTHTLLFSSCRALPDSKNPIHRKKKCPPVFSL